MIILIQRQEEENIVTEHAILCHCNKDEHFLWDRRPKAFIFSYHTFDVVVIYIHLHVITQEASLHASCSYIMDVYSPSLLGNSISLSSLDNFEAYMSMPFILVLTLLDLLKWFYFFFNV